MEAIRRIAIPARVTKLGNVGFGAFSRMFALGSQFVVLVLLGKLMPKSDFGDFMIVYALTRVIATGLGTGLATLLVYHISRDASEGAEFALHRSVTALGLAVSGAAAAMMVVFAPQIALWFGKPTLTFWVRDLAPFALFYTLLTISSGALDGRGKITRSIVFSEFIPNLIRLLALPPLLLLGLGNHAVAIVMIVSVLLPWIGIAYTLVRHIEAGFARLTAWDLQYSGKLTLHSFAAMQVQGIDMLTVGWLFPSTVAADYAIASRVAALIPFFQQIIVKGFMSKAGNALHSRNHTALQAEIDRSRFSSANLVTLTAISALAGYPVLLLLMGHFASSLPLLAALAISPVVRAYFPGADALLRVAGFANYSLAIMLTSGAFVVLFPILFDQWLGIYAIALGMFASAILLNPLISLYIRAKLDVDLMPATVWPPIAIAMVGTVICLIGNGDLFFWSAGVAVLGASLIPVYLENHRKRNLRRE